MRPKKDQSRPLRILYLLTDGFGGHGGIAAYNRDVLNAMCGDPAVGKVVALPRVIPLPLQALPPKLEYRVRAADGTAAYLRALLQAIARERFDVIYCAHIHLSSLALMASRLTGTPWILAMYGIDVWEKPRRRSARYACTRADQYLSISKITRDRFCSWSGVDAARVDLMPNAIHLEAFGLSPRNPDLVARYGLDGKRVVMTFGRMDTFERYKGFDEILDLLPTLTDQPEIVYVLAGDGADRKRLEAKAEALGVSDRAIFTGYVPEVEKADHYRLADAYAMPSTGEGFGFVLIEALACGVPTIGSIADGGREALRDGMLGDLVDPKDPDGIRRAVLAALGKPKAIPDGLSYFAFPAFSQRIAALTAKTAGR